jgi:D-alanyl-D-alanine carboxypeptidase
MRRIALAALAASAVTILPAPAEATTCGGIPGLQAELKKLTRTLAGAAVEVVDPKCGTWRAAAGVADRHTRRPMRVDERIRIGSITKTFTAALVLELAAEGRLSLDAPAARYVPGLVPRRITVRQLLQHTSGLPDHADIPESDEWRHRSFKPRELVKLALGLPRPKGWHYSTTNYVIAGMVVESVTGRTYSTELTERIIKPLGLHDTYDPGDSEHIRGPHPRSYTLVERNGKPVRVDGTVWNMSFGGAGGALVSTPADLNRFFGAKLPLLRQARSVAADEERLGKGARYGLGLMDLPMSCGGRWLGHGGTTPGGFRAWAAVAPDGRRVAFALNEVPASQKAEDEFHRAVDHALCAPLKETT